MDASAANGDREGLRRYAALIERALRAAPPTFAPATFVPTAESCGTIQLERGVAYALLVGDPSSPVERIAELLDPWADVTLAPSAVVDRAGHRRPGYRGLLFHAAFRAIALAGVGRVGPIATRWVGMLRVQLASLRWPGHPAGAIPADRGAAVADAVWMALAAHGAAAVEENASGRNLAAETFARLVSCQHPQGTFLTAGRSDNPEAHWYHELVLLQAATAYAAETGDPSLAAAVARNAAYHQDETQPDHATNQPWGLAAFAWNRATRPLADQVLHAAATIGASGITSILLADALYSLRLLTPRDA